DGGHRKRWKGMRLSRTLALTIGCVAWAAAPQAQISLTPPGLDAPSRAQPRAAPKAPPKAPARTAPPRRSAPRPAPAPPAPKSETPPTPQPRADTEAPVASDDPRVDAVYGAFQRGLYRTAFTLATERAERFQDPQAMTMLGELYAQGLGVK